MTADSEIGRIVSVDTAHVSIELNPDLKGMSRATYEGTQEVGRINSYIILPVGARRLVAMINRVVLVDDAGTGADRTMVALPAARRMMNATLIGTIDGRTFQQGLSVFPLLDNPVLLPRRDDLDAILGPLGDISATTNPNKPGYCIPIGESAVVQGRPIRIDPDAFFGKHAAILGSTGSGKSCTIATLLQSISEHSQVKRTTCVILDTNGEYRAAFQGKNDHSLYIPSDSRSPAERITIPYWFLNSEDFARIFQASKGVQRPVLLEALRLARNDTASSPPVATLRQELIRELNRIWSLSGRDEKTSKDVRDVAVGLKARIALADLQPAWTQVADDYNFAKGDVDDALNTVASVANRHIEKNTFPQILPADARKAIRDAIRPTYEKLSVIRSEPSVAERSSDAPAYFDKIKFRSQHIEQVLRREESGGARARDFSGTMLLRIDRLLADRRFDFLFGPVGEALPHPSHVLASFLRDTLAA